VTLDITSASTLLIELRGV